VDVHVRRLRAKLGPPFDSWIETVHQIGYRFRPDDESIN
jgi:DNA-binding response OmpR family regulator